MDFHPSDAGTALTKLTKEIVTGRDPSPDRFDRKLWTELASAGVLSAALPSSIGDGFGLLEQCAVLVELGRAVAAVPYLESIVVAASGLARAGAPWLDGVADGARVLTAALAEEPTVTAAADDKGWRLTGSVASVPWAPVADAILVPARTSSGPAVFVVTPDDPGVRIEPVDLVDLSCAGWLDVAGVSLPADRLVGTADLTDFLLMVATIGRCAWQVGVLEQALAMTAEHAKTRIQFDRPIAAFQAVTQRLADAYIDVEAVRLTMWQAAWRAAAGLPCRAEVATAKFWAADAGHRVAHTAVHIHGGMGIDVSHPMHRYFVAAKRTEFELGSATAQLRRLGALLANESA